MKIGDYVRTKKGIIGKLEKEQRTGHSDWIIDTLYYNYDEMINSLTCCIVSDDIVKSSPNIIDLIEEGDYVNGHKISNICNLIYTEDDQITYQDNEDIKSIVTHEQFSQMEYKVGE